MTGYSRPVKGILSPLLGEITKNQETIIKKFQAVHQLVELDIYLAAAKYLRFAAAFGKQWRRNTKQYQNTEYKLTIRWQLCCTPSSSSSPLKGEEISFELIAASLELRTVSYELSEVNRGCQFSNPTLLKIFGRSAQFFDFTRPDAREFFHEQTILGVLEMTVFGK